MLPYRKSFIRNEKLKNNFDWTWNRKNTEKTHLFP